MVTPDGAPSRSLTIAQLVFSVAGICLSLAGALGIIILLNSQTSTPVDNTQLVNFLWILLAVILLTIPSAIACIRYLAGRPTRQPVRSKWLFASLALILVPVLGWASIRFASSGSNTWLSAVINIPAVLIPIWWFLELGRARLSSGSVQRQWGLATFSFYITLPVVIMIEVVVLGIGLLFTALWVIQQPDFAPLLTQLQQQFVNSPQVFPDLTFDFLPLLQRTEVIIAALAAITLVVPMIEELLKPLALWLLHRRNLTAAQGFTAGLICGASFALLESLFSISAAMSGDWVFTVVGRAGTGLLHTLTAGLNGWALASTWQDGRWHRVGLTYILTVLIHGAWNLFAVLMGLNLVAEEVPWTINPVLTGAAVWVLVGLAAAMLVFLFLFNLKLRRARALPPPLPVIEDTALE